MASTTLSVVGGAFFGPVGAFVGGLAGSYIDAKYLFPPEGPGDTFGPRLDGASEQKYGYGDPLKRLHGNGLVGGSVIWADERKEIAHTTESGGGGKGGGSSSKHTSYTYTRSFAIAFLDTEGRDFAGVRRIFRNGKLIFDATESASIDGLYHNGNIADGVRVYTGSETQEIDPYIEAVDPDSPAFRGIAYIMFEDMDVTDISGSTPIITAEWSEAGQDSSAFNHWNVGNLGSTPAGSFQANGAGIQDGYCFVYGAVTVDGDDLPYMYRYTLSGDLIDARLDPPETAHLRTRTLQYGSQTQFGTSMIVGPEALGYYVFSITSSSIGVQIESNVAGVLPYSFGSGTVTPSTTAGRIYGWCYHGDLVFIFKKYSDRYMMEVWQVTQAPDLTPSINMLAEVDYSGLDIAFSEFFYNARTNSGGSGDFAVYADADALYVIHDGFGGAPASNDIIRYPFGDAYEIGEGEVIGGRSGTPHDGGADGGILFSGATNGTSSEYYLQALMPTLTNAAKPLEDVVEDMLQVCGYVAADYDLTDLVNDDVREFLIVPVESTRTSIEHLRRAYHFDLIEADWKIVAIKRGNAATVSIPYGDLATHQSGSARPEPLPRERKDESELPQKLTLSYYNEDANYDTASQFESRQVTNSILVETMSVPIALSHDEAKQAVSRIFWQRWEARVIYNDISLPLNYIYLSPGDVINVTDSSGDLHSVLLTEIELQPLILKAKGISYNEATATSTALGATTKSSSAVFEWNGLQIFLHMDGPPLHDTDARGFYAAAANRSGTFAPYALLKSNDDGQSYNTNVESIISPATIGVTTDSLSDGTPFVIDWTSTVNINTYGNALSSVTRAALLNGENRALVGNDGRWELIGYQTATLEADGSYTVSGLLRGLQGTEWAMDQHGYSDYFIVLSEDLIHSIGTTASDYNTEVYYLPVRDGQQLSEADPYPITEMSNRLKPFSPARLRGYYDAAGSAYGTFERRNRYDAEMRDGSDIPMSETTEDYQVQAWSGSTLVRTITSTASANGSAVNVEGKSFYYDAADISADGVSGAYELRVQQISSVVGAGYDGVISMAAPPGALTEVFDLTAVSGYAATWSLVALETDGTHLFVMAQDGVSSTSYADFIKTFSIDGNGDLTEDYSHTLSANSGIQSQVNFYLGMYYKQGKLYAIHTGGIKTYDVDANGQLTTAKSTYTRFTSAANHRAGAALSPAADKVFISMIAGAQAYQFSINDGENHGTVTAVTNVTSHYRNVRLHPNYFYTKGELSGVYVFVDAPDGKNWNQNGTEKTQTGLGNFLLQAPFRDRLYFTSDNTLATADGYFPLDVDGSWDGAAVEFATAEDWSGRTGQFGPFDKHEVSVGGFVYVYRIGQDIVERKA